MLSKQHRLSSTEMRHLLKTGGRVRFRTASVCVAPSQIFKCGAVVSKKKGVTAIERNAARRSVYAACKEMQTVLPAIHVAVSLQVQHKKTPCIADVYEVLRLLQEKHR